MRCRAMGCRTSTPKMEAGPAGGVDKSQQDIHGGGLAGAIGPEKAEDLALERRQIQAFHRQLGALSEFP